MKPFTHSTVTSDSSIKQAKIEVTLFSEDDLNVGPFHQLETQLLDTMEISEQKPSHSHKHKEIMNPNYFPSFEDCPSSEDYPNSQNYPNYFSNSQNYQSYQVTRFSPNLNQNLISEQVQPSQNISRILFRGVEQTDTNQKETKMGWLVKEDVALMSAWCFVSENKIKDKNQKGVSLWARVHAMFHKAQVENPKEIYERSIESLRCRFKRLTINGNKWLAAYKKAYNRKQSGMSLKDVEKETHTIYEANGSKFQNLVVFNEVMSKHPKWELTFDRDATRFRSENEEGNEESCGTSKRLKTTEDGDYSISSNSQTPSTCSTMSRPTGIDKAKLKGKCKVSQSSSPNKVVAEIRALKLTKDNEVKLMRARLELEREKLQRNSMKMKEKMLNTLLKKDHLSPEDEDMKRRLMAIVFGP